MTMPQPMGLSKTSPRCMARAMYDNLADTPDELAFRRGDILTVLEQNTAGAEGWWLCSLRGRQGICPGNRLRLLAGVYDTGGAPPSPPPTPTPIQQSANSTLRHSSNPQTPHSAQFLYRGHARRKSWNTQPSKVILPQRIGDLYIYEQPQVISPHPGMETYDVPRTAVPVISPSPRLPPTNAVPASDWYDVPRALACHPLLHHQLTPSSSNSSLTIDSMSSSNRSSLANMPEYDIPRSRGSNSTLCAASIRYPSPAPSLAPSIVSSHSIHSATYDVPPCNPQLKELPLQWTEAMDMLEKLQSEATDAISKLLGFVKPCWRSHSNLSTQLLDVRLCSLRLRAALHDLADFTEGTMGNAATAHDKGLAIKFRPLVKTLRDADRLVNKIITNLDALNWSIDLLCRPDDYSEDLTNPVTPDSLDQLVACARALTEDVRQTASFIQGNSTLLFKKSKSLQMKENVGEWVEEYDYVKLESREIVDKKHAEIKESLPSELKKNFETVLRDADYSMTSLSMTMAPNDKQLITYYAKQTITYFNHLTTAIDAFLQTVERNQPPAIFLAHGKFVVLSAHRLVYIGDSVHRIVENTEFKMKILAYSNNLSDGLATTVTKAKNAALNYPSVTAVQDMVDAVVDVSNYGREMKICMVQTANQP